MYLIPQLASGHTGELALPLNTLAPTIIEYFCLITKCPQLITMIPVTLP